MPSQFVIFSSFRFYIALIISTSRLFSWTQAVKLGAFSYCHPVPFAGSIAVRLHHCISILLGLSLRPKRFLFQNSVLYSFPTSQTTFVSQITRLIFVLALCLLLLIKTHLFGSVSRLTLRIHIPFAIPPTYLDNLAIFPSIIFLLSIFVEQLNSSYAFFFILSHFNCTLYLHGEKGKKTKRILREEYLYLFSSFSSVIIIIANLLRKRTAEAFYIFPRFVGVFKV